MASRGSVIPVFVEQMKANKPITITDPEMTRFLMNLDEAVDLVLFAFEHANQGDLFIQKSPASTVGVLADALKEMFKSDSKINVIGTRHGEKAHETLMTKEESAKAIDMGNYFRIPADNRDLNYDKYLEDGSKKITEAEEYTSASTTRLDTKNAIKKLLTVDYINEELKVTQ
jgi:UDP-glucose 4-epimerase